MYDASDGPRYVLWELTRDSNQPTVLTPKIAPGNRDSPEMTTAQAAKFIDSVAKVYSTTLIFGGGEPLVRSDVFSLAEYARSKGLGVILTTNGAFFDAEAARRCVEARVRGVQIMLDGSSARSHDGFRDAPGSFTQAIKAIELVKLAGIKFEIYTFVTQKNAHEIPRIDNLAQKLGAWGHTFFFAIPTLVGEHLAKEALSVDDYQSWLNWLFEQKYRLRMNIKSVCTPQFKRIIQERGNELPDPVNPLKSVAAMEALGPGCPGGKTVCFVSAGGDVFPCAYTSHSAGSVLKRSFKAIWEKSPVFEDFRAQERLQDKCGRCEYRETCQGCRALAEKASGDYLGQDPTCPYQPVETSSSRGRKVSRRRR